MIKINFKTMNIWYLVRFYKYKYFWEKITFYSFHHIFQSCYQSHTPKIDRSCCEKSYESHEHLGLLERLLTKNWIDANGTAFAYVRVVFNRIVSSDINYCGHFITAMGPVINEMVRRRWHRRRRRCCHRHSTMRRDASDITLYRCLFGTIFAYSMKFTK